MIIKVRSETARDCNAVKKVHDLAFGKPDEGLLVEKLRHNKQFKRNLSLVAGLEENVIGHILFFPVKITDGPTVHTSLALAPMSVLPEYQNQGVGGMMIIKGFKTAKQSGYRSVIVLGHKDYYPRFGFQPASKWNIKPPFEVPDAVFMAVELLPGGLKNVSGTVEYPPEFGI